MKSFKVILVRNFTGMLFIVLGIAYVLFNVLTNNFISAEADRELSRSVSSIESIANRTPVGVFPFNDPPISIVIMEDILTQIRQMNSLRQLMMNTDGIIISEHNEVVSPNIHQMEKEVASEIIFLVNHYVNNRDLFEADSMIRLASANNTYYLIAIEYPMAYGTSFSVLLYTDITSARMFMRNINRTLGILLIVSAIVSVLMSVLVSSKVQKSIIRLGDYAAVVGQGNFTEKVGNFDYKEFNNLAQSMNTMSTMLSTYENNQKQFFQNVSHELRTPLMSIQGYAEGGLENVLAKDEAFKIILTESERMEGLVGQLLYVSRLDSGLDAINIVPFDLRDLLYDSAWRMKILADKSGKELVLDFPSGAYHINSDEEKLQRVIDNILANGIRHARTKVKIGYSVQDDSIEITIEDDGTGIKEDDLPHIFERFYKGTNGNSGLGLAICKDIIEKLGGSIKAENTTGFTETHTTGAKFTVTLPLTLSVYFE